MQLTSFYILNRGYINLNLGELSMRNTYIEKTFDTITLEMISYLESLQYSTARINRYKFALMATIDWILEKSV